MKDNFLVVDIGSQSLRASVVSPKGEILAFSKQSYDTPFLSPEKGFAEQDVNYYLEELCKATGEIHEKQPELLESVIGMVVVVFRDSMVMLDKDKKPIRNAILWLDQRVTRLPKMQNFTWYEKVLFRLIGMTDAVRYNAERTPTYWIMDHEPENWKKLAYYCPLGAYFNYRITGHLAVSTADAVGHYPIDFKSGHWYSKHHPKQDVFHIPYDSLPELVPVSKVIGNVTEEFSSLSYIPKGLPVYACASDKACEVFGNGCTDKYSASISLGTACTIDVVDSVYKEPEQFLPTYEAPYPKAYDQEIQIYYGLLMTRWYLDNFGANDIMEAKELGIPVEEYLNQKIKDVPVGCDGLVLQPYWQPGLKRPNAKGSIIGFSNVHTRYHLYRAIYEGLAFALREGLDEIVKKTHQVPNYLVLSGGGSKSDQLNQIIADVFGIDCMISHQSESTTIGAAMAGFVDAGVYPSPEEAKKNMIVPGKMIHADEKNHAIYDKLYHNVYLKLYPSLKEVYNNCKDFALEEEQKEIAEKNK